MNQKNGRDKRKERKKKKERKERNKKEKKMVFPLIFPALFQLSPPMHIFFPQFSPLVLFPFNKAIDI